MKIFAYGSNMCLTRLTDRVPSATFFSKAKLSCHTLLFHKRSKDGSGKANAFKSEGNDALIWGAIFEISDHEKYHLDAAEGLGNGYDEKTIVAVLPDNSEVDVRLYVANESAIDNNLQPYSWYMTYLVQGAKDWEFPESYIDFLANIKCKTDNNASRRQANASIIQRHLQKHRL